MNLIRARLKEIHVHEGVSLLRFDGGAAELTMVGLEPPRGLKEGMEADLGIKATHLILSRHSEHATTLLNLLPVRCQEIHTGALLASVTLDYEGTTLEAILPSPALGRLALREGEEIYALFQAAELSIARVLK